MISNRRLSNTSLLAATIFSLLILQSPSSHAAPISKLLPIAPRHPATFFSASSLSSLSQLQLSETQLLLEQQQQLQQVQRQPTSTGRAQIRRRRLEEPPFASSSDTVAESWFRSQQQQSQQQPQQQQQTINTDPSPPSWPSQQESKPIWSDRTLEGHAVLDEDDDDAGNELLDTEADGFLRPDADDEIEDTIEGQILVEEEEDEDEGEGYEDQFGENDIGLQNEVDEDMYTFMESRNHERTPHQVDPMWKGMIRKLSPVAGLPEKINGESAQIISNV
ncbi:hypothetical protein BX616_006258 [Lobosporangium transversale]|uniref:Uncharacterized protein n=1 Tax=Lobosporangium transversale TaxID=64571 RepID=A0A1Y2GFV8_9FUNG|nr:hypothetical protein BCR41DRAFT_361188 [Lobosporangium transversale]KAF9897055.1 hypothetical protein BX616_006258 [Lobosporangium transversale]ORZ06398.1 hypothetical protein BCR41DRAFT_361188 [Lobosporangium transversale]|eukprot:XP_021877561.1 hypothetical protein BCR41DRAFT_361188 [Lobosporangium transversale]